MAITNVPLTRKPWYGKGVPLNTIDITQALIDSGLDFDVAMVGVKTETPIIPTDPSCSSRFGKDTHPVSLIDRMTYRTDTGQELGMVGMAYTILQNSAVFAFISELLAVKIENKLAFPSAKLNLTGDFMNGRRVYAVIDLGMMKIGPHSLRRSVILTWSHDAWWSFSARFLCVNTANNVLLSAPLVGVTDRIAIKHTANIGNRVLEAAQVMKSAAVYFGTVEEQFDTLVDATITEKETKQFLAHFYTGSTKQTKKSAETKRDEVLETIKTGPGMRNVADTKWALFNGIALHETFRSRTALRKGTPYADREESRLHALLFGDANDTMKLTRSAFQKLMKSS